MYSLICIDKPDHVQLRADNRPAHVDYVLASPTVLVAGPFLNDDDETMAGTMVLLDVANRAEAEDWTTRDPYALAGLFERVEIRRWKHLIGTLPDPNAPDSNAS